MKIVLGCDHAGFALKSTAAELVKSLGHTLLDVGAKTLEPEDDYPDFAKAVSIAVQTGQAERGILLCGSGVGVSIAANKFKGIRAAFCGDTFSAHQGVEDDDANVLCLGARVTGPSLARDIIRTFLQAQFSEASRHMRRIQKIRDFDNRLG
jgi:ribose 5-phosphate isomerase B